MTNPDIHLHIDRIVLHGYEHIDRARMRAALEGELSRLFRARGVPGGLGASDRSHLTAPPLRAAADATPEHLGTRLAHTIYGGLCS